MSFLDVVLLGVALSMDAFAISVTNGMIYRKSIFDTAVKCGFCFGFFQFLMPVAGFFAGSLFYEHIKKIDHWLALILLAFLGIKMIIESVKEMKERKIEYKIAVPCILCAVAGNLAGSQIAIKKGAKFIKPVLAVVALMLLVKIVIQFVQDF
ncbi:MAG: manganese efflux pump [Treponema sp.]|nr:manganese efflux pump [Treponema sp.]